MRKLITFIIALSILMLSLVGCHGFQEHGAFDVPDDFDLSKVHEITFWAKNDTNKTQTDIYKKAIADFQELYPNINVTMRLYTDYSRIYNDVITNLSTNTTPNVCITYPDHIATYMTGTNAVVPLDALFADKKYGFGGSEVLFDSPKQGEIIPKFLSECILDGSYYAIPYMRSTEACYINKDLVEALGYSIPDMLTWDFVWEVSDAAMAKADDGSFLINGQNVMIPFIYKSTDNMMIQQLRQKGAGYSTDNGQIEIFNDTTTELLYTIAEHTKLGAFSTFKISSYPGNFLNAGQCIFAVDSTAGATWMGSNAPLLDISEEQIVDFNIVVTAIPQFDPENPQMISQGPSVCIFNKDDPQEVLASWLFAQYLLTDDVQIAYSQTEGYIPVTSKAQDSEIYIDYLSRSGEDNSMYYDVKIQASRLLLDNIGNTFITPVWNGSASLRNAAGQLIENVTKSVRRKETVNDAYMAKLFVDVSALYRLDQNDSQMGTNTDGKTVFGPLPQTAKALLSSLIIAWIFIALYILTASMKKKSSKLAL